MLVSPPVEANCTLPAPSHIPVPPGSSVAFSWTVSAHIYLSAPAEDVTRLLVISMVSVNSQVSGFALV